MKEMQKLNLNENQYTIEEWLKKKAVKSVELSNFYLDTQVESETLSQVIADKMHISEENVNLSNGIDEILLFMALSANKLGGIVVTTEHTYKGFDYALQYILDGISKYEDTLFKVPINKMVIDLDDLVKEITGKGVSMIYVCNPLNPVGNIMVGDIKKFLDYTSKNSIIVLFDEAYAEYGDDDFVSMIKFAKIYKNIVIARTFSKAYGLAGLRCAYMITYNEYILEQFKSFYKAVPYSINRIAYDLSKEVIKNDAYLQEVRKRTAVEREYLGRELKKMGIIYYPSVTNFLLAEYGKDSEELVLFLRNKGFLIRSTKDFDLDGHIRITIGTHKQMENLVQIIKEYRKGKIEA